MWGAIDMAKVPLTAKEVNSFSSDKLWVSPCLYLIRNKTDTLSWSSLYQVNGQRREMGLVSVTDVSLSEARPLVDVTVKRLVTNGHTTVSPETKRALAALLDFAVNLGTTRSPVKTAITTLCNSLVSSYANRKAKLIFLDPPDPISLSALGVVDDHS